MAQNLRPGPNWIPGVIIERAGPLSYVIETEDKQIWKRYVDQLKVLGDGVLLEASSEDAEPIYPSSPTVQSEDDTETTDSTETAGMANTEAVQPETDSSNTAQLSVGESLVPMSRYPTHNRKPPNRLA